VTSWQLEPEREAPHDHPPPHRHRLGHRLLRPHRRGCRHRPPQPRSAPRL